MLKKKGYIVISDFFSDKEIQHMREVSEEYLFSGNGFLTDGGISKPDWVNDSRLNSIKNIIYEKKIEFEIQKHIKREVHFLGHCDLQVNRTCGWHKDRLNGEARKFEKTNPWTTIAGEEMQIYKAFIYLQNHIDNNDCLRVVPQSHLREDLSHDNVEQIKMKSNDILISDVRITHSAVWSGGYNRFLISLSYGVDNVFSKEYKDGVRFRQNKQNRIIERNKR
jgi:hypothetical protein